MFTLAYCLNRNSYQVMNNIDFLKQRQSNPSLSLPAPTQSHLNDIIEAGIRVPDHACLQPFHFTVVSGEGLNKLSKLFVESSDPNTANLDKISKMPLRAPMIIIVSTQYCEHEKVPKQEQLITAGCSAHAMQMAAVSLGYGAMWRTGDLAYNAKVKQGLTVSEDNEIVGFLYVGTETKILALKPTKSAKEKVSYWD